MFDPAWLKGELVARLGYRSAEVSVNWADRGGVGSVC